MRRFTVEVAGPAIADLDEIYSYDASVMPPARAGKLVARLEAAIQALAHAPERGPHPPELLALGVQAYRQIVRPPFRIVYRVRDRSVYVLLVADGRRDMRRLLESRLFSPSV
ncbi:MAG: type II toxin-antitoxin system RelE/ParE family toxin [Rhodospirillaceae bacterium]|nr:type II toxin-antitoxin system RelE/ParE family toxin [Rhodospirillaceae bacterium]